jgi:apolipoprotein N-acyltransferase
MTQGLRLFLRADVQVVAAVLAGVAAALGQAPWGLWPVALLGYAGLFALMRGKSLRRALGLAWLAGLAHFMLAMGWIVQPFLIEPDRHAWMAPFALFGLAGGLGLFWMAAALPGSVARRAMAFLAAEALRGHLFTGLPWAMAGHVWIDTPVAQVAALGGALGLSALTLGLAATMARGQRGAFAGMVALAAAGWVFGASRPPAPEPRGPMIRIVQPNAPQDLKWDPRHAEYWFLQHLDLTAQPGAADAPPPELVIWPETAVPFLLDRPFDGLDMAARAAGGARIAMGIQRRDGQGRYFNSLAVIGPAAQIEAVYDKHHLVPFGEYVPVLGHWADRWPALAGFAMQQLQGYTPGQGPDVLDLGDLGLALPLICYEAVFARNLRTDTRPDWVMQATNDAWFGTASGPFQHLAQARLRAIEQGLPVLRSANTGVSAVIDARGRVIGSLGMGQAGVIDSPLPPALPATVYAHLGDGPWHLIIGLWLGTVIWRFRRERRI